LFKSKSINKSLSELIVVVTPEIVDPATQPGTENEPVIPSPAIDPKVFDKTLPKDK
jgi:pilus assembly protein CpaC